MEETDEKKEKLNGLLSRANIYSEWIGAELKSSLKNEGKQEEVFDKAKFTLFQGTLRDYQITGINWLLKLHSNGIA